MKLIVQIYFAHLNRILLNVFFFSFIALKCYYLNHLNGAPFRSLSRRRLRKAKRAMGAILNDNTLPSGPLHQTNIIFAAFRKNALGLFQINRVV